MKFKLLSTLYLCGALLTSPAALAASDSSQTDSKWNVMIGLGVGSIPQYMGSKDHDVVAIPAVVIDYEFHKKNHLFVNSYKGAGYEFAGDHIIWGAKVDWRRGRDSEDSQIFTGMDDIDDSATGGFYAGLKLGELTLMAEYAAGLDNNNDGVLNTLSAKYALHSLSRPMNGYVGVKAVYGDDAYNESYVGVSDVNATADRPLYEGEAGFVRMGVVGGVDYLLNDHHYFRLDTSYMALPSHVTDSVLVDEDYEYSALVSYGYKF
jgi:outer membrane scaffolding protein for murein synthesis (MipA/OmpV family)